MNHHRDPEVKRCDPADENTSRLAAIVETSEDAIIGKTLEGTITSWNPSAERLYGYSLQEVIGQPISILMPSERKHEMKDILTKIRRGERVEHYETVRVRKDGTRLDVLVAVSPIRDATGRTVGAATTTHDITERKQVEEEREQLLAELDAIIDSVADGLVVYGPTGHISRLNDAAEQIFGLAPVDAGLSLQERAAVLQAKTADGKPIPADDLPASRALRGETVQGAVMVWQLSGGKTIWVSCSAAPIHGPGGRRLGAVVTFTNITELHKIQEQREDLLKMVSHDLRSPLTAVQGQAQLLQRLLDRSGQDGQMRQAAEAIFTSARRMNAMIQDLVDMARVEFRQLRLNCTPIELRPYLLELKQRLAGALDTGRIRVEIPEGLPPVLADQDRLERVLVNLLSNALKYSDPQTEVLVTADRLNGEMKVSVTDQGVGIPPEDCAHIFERFYRIKGTRKAEGLGLGLYITRMLVEAMGGRIWVKSEEGKGSSFSFSLHIANS